MTRDATSPEVSFEEGEGDWQSRIRRASEELVLGESAFLAGPVEDPEERVCQLVVDLSGNAEKTIEAFFAKDRQEGWVGVGVAEEMLLEQGSSFQMSMEKMEAWRRVLPEGAKAFFSIPFDVEDTRDAPEWQGFLGVRAVLPALLLHVTGKGIRLTKLGMQKIDWLKEKPVTTLKLQATEVQATPTKEKWMTWIAALTALFHQGGMQKVVAARRLELRLQRAASSLDLLPSRKEKSGFFFFWQRGEACFMGQSPELLCDFQGEEMRTAALAGTQPRSSSPKENQRRGELLSNSAKDLHEQSVVADFLEERLGAYGRVSQAELEVRELEHLLHLQSLFRVRLHTFPRAGLVGVVHPTPAVSGFPQQEAIEYLRENEPFHRGLYAGAVGVMSSRESLSCVGIRSMLSRGREVFLYTGAGIVAGSKPNAEWEEMEQKAKPIAALFSMSKTGKKS